MDWKYEIEKIICCPKCKNTLISSNGDLFCQNCNQRFRKNGFLNLLPNQKNNFIKIEEKFWDQTYIQEGERDVNNRNSIFHLHFRKPLLNLPDNSLILELGCGNRADALEIAKTHKQIIETDISPAALKLSKQLSRKMNVFENVYFIQASAENLPFVDNSFSGVLMAAAFHHIEKPLAGLKEIKRVSKHNGLVVFGVEPNAWPYKTIYRWLKPVKKYIRNHRQRDYDSIADDNTNGFNKKDFINLFQKAGIELVEIKPVKFTLEFYDSYIRLIDRLTKNKHKQSVKVVKFLENLDESLAKIPIIKESQRKEISFHFALLTTYFRLVFIS